MKNYLNVALLVGVAALTAVSARASVTYSTTGIFHCTNAGNLTGCGTNVLDFGTAPNNAGVPDIILTLAGEATNTVTPITGGPFGDLVLSCGDTLADCGTEILAPGISFTITINQSSPAFAPAPLNLDATLSSGTLTGSSTGTVAVVYSGPSFVTFGDGTAYTIGPLNQPLIPPSSGGGTPGDLSLQGTITTASNVTPEPATFGMLGAALIGLGLVVRKRKA
jgi:hypothetical protein